MQLVRSIALQRELLRGPFVSCRTLFANLYICISSMCICIFGYICILTSGDIIPKDNLYRVWLQKSLPDNVAVDVGQDLSYPGCIGAYSHRNGWNPFTKKTHVYDNWYVSMQQILHCRRLSIVKELDLAESKMFIVQQRCPNNSNTRVWWKQECV